MHVVMMMIPTTTSIPHPRPLPQSPVPPPCLALRQAFLAHCPAAWSAHFDAQRYANIRQLLIQRKQIQHLYRSGQLDGGLAGRNQQHDDR